MAGRFNGLTDVQWEILEPLMPKDPYKKLKGKPHTPWRKVCNTIFWIMITGSRWVDLPLGEKWASRSASHRWLGIWQVDGTLILSALREAAFLEGLIEWDRMATDGFFFAGKGGGELVDYGYKGKGVTSHLLVVRFLFGQSKTCYRNFPLKVFWLWIMLHSIKANLCKKRLKLQAIPWNIFLPIPLT